MDKTKMGKIIRKSLEATDIVSSLEENYWDILKYLWDDFDGVEVITEVLIPSQIILKVDENKKDDYYKTIKKLGYTVHKGKEDWSDRLIILWGDLP